MAGTHHTGSIAEQRSGMTAPLSVCRALAQGATNVEVSTSVGKALALLEAFNRDCTVLGVTKLATIAGLPKSTAHRLLNVMVSRNLLVRVGTQYAIGPRVVELASLADDTAMTSLHEVTLPYLQDLYEATHQTIHLALLDAPDVVYLEKLYGHNQTHMASRLGGRLNAGCCALGKALMAFSDDEITIEVLRSLRPRTRYTIASPKAWAQELTSIQAQGVAIDREESGLGVGCIAAPIFGRDDKVVAAVSIAGPLRRFEPLHKASLIKTKAESMSHAVVALGL